MSDLQFDGFELPKPKKEKDLPPRPLPEPIPTESVRAWSPQVPEDEMPVGEEHTKRVVVGIVNLALPIIGVTIVLGGIVAVITFIFSFYSK